MPSKADRRDLDALEKVFHAIVEDQAKHLPAVGDIPSPDRAPANLAREVEETVRALQVFFNKWTVEVMFILMVHDIVRFNELKRLLKGISGRTLSARLKELESQGLVKRTLFDEMPVRVEYALTEQGRMVADLCLPAVMYLRVHGIGAKPPADASRWD